MVVEGGMYMNDVELRAHEFALEMVSIYEKFILNVKHDIHLKAASDAQSDNIKIDVLEAMNLYKTIFESAKKEFTD
jgi:hypothetical protein